MPGLFIIKIESNNWSPYEAKKVNSVQVSILFYWRPNHGESFRAVKINHKNLVK